MISNDVPKQAEKTYIERVQEIEKGKRELTKESKRDLWKMTSSFLLFAALTTMFGVKAFTHSDIRLKVLSGEISVFFGAATVYFGRERRREIKFIKELKEKGFYRE